MKYLLSQVKIRKEDLSEEEFIELRRQFLLKYEGEINSIIEEIITSKKITQSDIVNNLTGLTDIVMSINMPENMKFNKTEIREQINDMLIPQFNNKNLMNTMQPSLDMKLISQFIKNSINAVADNQQLVIKRGGKQRNTKTSKKAKKSIKAKKFMKAKRSKKATNSMKSKKSKKSKKAKKAKKSKGRKTRKH